MSKLPITLKKYSNVSVVVGIKPSLDSLSSHIWTLEVGLPQAEARLIHDEIEEFIHKERMLYELRANEGRFSWGADGGFQLEVLAFLAQTFASGAIAAITTELFQKLITRQREVGSFSDGYIENLDRESAIGYAEWILISKYFRPQGVELDPDESGLTLVAEQENLENGSWKFSYKDKDNVVYHVTLGVIEGVFSATMVEREQP